MGIIVGLRINDSSLGSNGDLNFHTSLNVDDDLLHRLSRGEETRTQYVSMTFTKLNRMDCHRLNQTLVNAHLVVIPGLGTLTVGSLAGRDVQGLSGKTDGALDMKGFRAGTIDQLSAHLLERADLARGQGDTDLVDLLLSIE